MTNTTKPELELMGHDGNAFMILGLARRAATNAGMDWTALYEEATAGDYDHMLRVLMQYFDIV